MLIVANKKETAKQLAINESAMTQSELITQLAAQFPRLAFKNVGAAVKIILNAMTETLRLGQRIEIRGVGSFHVKQQPARQARNPKSGQTVTVPAKYRVYFRSSKKLRGK